MPPHLDNLVATLTKMADSYGQDDRDDILKANYLRALCVKLEESPQKWIEACTYQTIEISVPGEEGLHAYAGPYLFDFDEIREIVNCLFCCNLNV